MNLVVLLSCVAADDPRDPGTSDGSPPTTPTPPSERPDPFAPQPDPQTGLVDVSADLEAVLEHGALIGACDRWRAAPDDRELQLLCGKSMFFYEGFDTLGIPTPLFDFVHQNFTAEVGPGFSGLGLIVHPGSPEGRPIGFAPGALLGDVETQALTCASCHFAQLPDGRYAVGAPNHAYQYGRHMLSLILAPMAASPTFDEADHHPDAIAAIQPMLDRLQSDPWLGIQLGLEMLPLLDSLGEVATLTVEQEGQYASWPAGTMDFMIAPVPLDDGVHTVSKISPLWGIPDAEEEQAAGMRHAMLGWTGGTDSIDSFLRGFVVLGDGSAWADEDLVPLREYLLTLRPPAPPSPPPADTVAQGEDLFGSAGCIDCHQGPRGSGLDVFTYEEIGTDAAMEGWADGETCCVMDGTELTHGIKSPRLVGMWAQSRLLHNGSVTGLEALLCESPRPTIDTPALSDGGHTYGCDLAPEDKDSLIAYLLAH
jgi:hypothetical protein